MSGSGRGLPDERGYVEWFTERIAERARREVREDMPLIECGLDSVALLGLYGDAETAFGPLPDHPVEVWPYSTIRGLARRLAVRDGRADRRAGIRTAFVFSGQGCQHPRMTAGLYRHCTAYRQHLGEADEALAPHLGRSVVELLTEERPEVHETALAQPALFAVEYALATTLLEEGVRPVAVAGHGVGEFAAATVAGALPLAAAAGLVASRGTLMQRMPAGGGMMATCADPYEAAEAATAEPGVSIGALNAARATVLTGDLAGLERARRRLADIGIASTFLQVRHAFHSPLMEPVAPLFEELARRAPAGDGGAALLLDGSRPPLRRPAGRRVLGAADHLPGALHRRRARPAHGAVADPCGGDRAQGGSHPFLRRMGGPRGPACLAVCRSPRTNAVDLAGVLSALDAGPLSDDPDAPE